MRPILLLLPQITPTRRQLLALAGLLAVEPIKGRLQPRLAPLYPSLCRTADGKSAPPLRRGKRRLGAFSSSDRPALSPGLRLADLTY